MPEKSPKTSLLEILQKWPSDDIVGEAQIPRRINELWVSIERGDRREAEARLQVLKDGLARVSQTIQPRDRSAAKAAFREVLDEIETIVDNLATP